MALEGPLTVEQAARLLKVPRTTIYSWIRSKKIKPLPRRLDERRLYFPVNEITTLLDRLPVTEGSDSELAYRLMKRRYARLPDSYSDRIDEDLAFLKQEFTALSQELGTLHHPYLVWGIMFGEISDILGCILPSDAYHELAGSDTLRLRGVFEKDLSNHMAEVRACLESGDDIGISEKIRIFRDRMKSWHTFAVTWQNFRAAASECFDDPQAVKEGDYDELIHPTQVIAWDTKRQRGVNWNAWIRLTSRPKVMDRMVDWITEAVRNLNWDFDAICELSSSTQALAILLGLKLDKAVLASDNRTLNFLPRDWQTDLGNRIIFVDMVSQTGEHLAKAVERVETGGGIAVGAIFITINNMLKNPERKLAIVDEWHRQAKLIYCYNLSTLYGMRYGQCSEC